MVEFIRFQESLWVVYDGTPDPSFWCAQALGCFQGGQNWVAFSQDAIYCLPPPPAIIYFSVFIFMRKSRPMKFKWPTHNHSHIKGWYILSQLFFFNWLPISTGGIFRSRMVSREADFTVYGTPLEEWLPHRVEKAWNHLYNLLSQMGPFWEWKWELLIRRPEHQV